MIIWNPIKSLSLSIRIRRDRFQLYASLFQDSHGVWEIKIKINICEFSIKKLVSVGFPLTPKCITLTVDVNILDCIGSYMDKTIFFATSHLFFSFPIL